VVRLEHRGVRALRRLARAGGCTGGGSSPGGAGGDRGAAGSPVFGSDVLASGSLDLLSPGADGTLLASTRGPGSPRSDRGSRGDDASGPDRGGVLGASAEQPATVLPPADSPGSDRTPWLVLVVLVGILGFGLRTLRATRA
jgi:hypothetical protein